MKRHQRGIGVALAATVLLIAGCGSSSKSSNATASPGASTSSSSGGGGSVNVNGAGSTFAAPIYQQWGSTLSGQGVTVNYSSVGSGAGIAQLQAGTVDFAGSDPAMKSTEIAKAKGPVAQFPIGFGGITVSYNLQSVKSGIKLDAKTIADIYRGKVKSWDDPEIKALNPGLSLPGTTITVVHRSDSSGTTKGFTTFLSDYDPAWTAAAGKPDKTVNWPTGTGAKGNAGVAAAIKQTAGAIGYVEQAYALQNNFTFAAIKNKAGSFVLPTLDAASAAAASVPASSPSKVKTINAPGAQSYPITSQTFLIVYKDMCKAGVSKSVASGVKKLIAFGLGQGQSIEKQLFYAPLPPALLAKDQAELNSLTCNGSPLA